MSVLEVRKQLYHIAKIYHPELNYNTAPASELVSLAEESMQKIIENAKKVIENAKEKAKKPKFYAPRTLANYDLDFEELCEDNDLEFNEKDAKKVYIAYYKRQSEECKLRETKRIKDQLDAREIL